MCVCCDVFCPFVFETFLSVPQADDGDLLGNGNEMNLATDVTPCSMEDTHQRYMDMFVGPECDIGASQDVVNTTVKTEPY